MFVYETMDENDVKASSLFFFFQKTIVNFQVGVQNYFNNMITYLLSKLIDCIDISLNRSCHDIGIGTKSIVDMIVIFHTLVHFREVIRAF